jgi:BirA family biotin operon repressor/biotin-[acetyl-CoA-carboxylase] ligase
MARTFADKIAETVILERVGSTNSYALENFDAFGNGTLILARSQSSGRGRKGRVWSSPPSVNVYASLILKGFKFLPAQASWLGSLAVLETLRLEAPRMELRVKWPNDVLCGKAKIAGVLCEAKSGPRGGIVIGMGVNLNMTKADLEEIGRPATSVLVETGKPVEDVDAFGIILGGEAMRLYAVATRDGVKSLHALWSSETRLAGSEVEAVLDDGSSFAGVVESVNLDGSLSIRRADGSSRSVASGEVSLRDMPESAKAFVVARK